MASIDFPEPLLDLERAAWAEIQAGGLTLDTARAVQTAVTAFAAEGRHDRYTVEMGLKKAIRHPAAAG